MSATADNLAVLIPLIFAGLAATIGAVFAGLVALRQLPASKAQAEIQSTKLDQVQTTVNGASSAKDQTIAAHVATIAALQAQIQSLTPPSPPKGP